MKNRTGTTEYANAHPRKRFFLEMFTRDINLEDTVLDLIDNSIDGLARNRRVDISPALLPEGIPSSLRRGALPAIHCTYSEDEFVLWDNCGGIPRDLALHEVFSFGHSEQYSGSQLGIYGVGLKRALFKLGREFEIESKTAAGGFRAQVDIGEWAKKDRDPEDWKIPLIFTPATRRGETEGTKIVVRQLTGEVKARLKDPTFTADLGAAISKTYLLFLEKYVTVDLQRTRIRPWAVPLGRSSAVTPAHKTLSLRIDGGNVEVKIIASLAERGSRNEWAYDRAGWYVFCNNRAVLTADKGEMTGWGTSGMPKYHSKYNGFIGLLFFQSTNPLLLPWRTTKRGINPDSIAYQRVRSEMAAVARPIITFLNEMYPSDLAEELPERKVAEGVKGADVRSLAHARNTDFSVRRGRSRSGESVSIQFKARKRDVERIKKLIREPQWSASKVGEHTFTHFVEHELGE